MSAWKRCALVAPLAFVAGCETTASFYLEKDLYLEPHAVSNPASPEPDGKARVQVEFKNPGPGLGLKD